MLQSPRKGKNANEKKQLLHNFLTNSRLQTLPMSRVFATNFVVGCFYASYERVFVKKIQHQFSFHLRTILNLSHWCSPFIPFD